MSNTKISAEIIAYSENPWKNRIVTFKLISPGIIQKEILRHRGSSLSVSSHRAIPFTKLAQEVLNDLFVPYAFGKSHHGMQAKEYIVDPQDLLICKQNWINASKVAVDYATTLNDLDISKDLCNRIIEPYTWDVILLTTTMENLDNFFNLRLPKYVMKDHEHEIFRSKQDYIEKYGDPKLSYVEWLNYNKSAAEIHIQELAECMYDAMNNATPTELDAGEYHIPYLDKIKKLIPKTIPVPEGESMYDTLENLMIKTSIGLCANTSYTTIESTVKEDYYKYVAICDKCIKLRHDSVLEHVARVPNSSEYYLNYKGQLPDQILDLNANSGWFDNFHGFESYRHIIKH